MGAEVNLLAVGAAVISSIIVGFIFYAKPVFGNQWAKLTGANMDDKTGMAQKMTIMLITSIITAYVLASIIFFYNEYFLNAFFGDALAVGFWVWLGLTASRVLVHDTFEKRNPKLTTITSLNEFITIMVMAGVIGAIGL